jgi:hypothetical protein
MDSSARLSEPPSAAAADASMNGILLSLFHTDIRHLLTSCFAADGDAPRGEAREPPSPAQARAHAMRAGRPKEWLTLAALASPPMRGRRDPA